MNSRNIIKATLNFDGIERVGHSFDEDDFIRVGNAAKTHATDWKQLAENRWQRTDMWGNIWARLDNSSKGEVVKGVLESLDDAEVCEFPDFSNPQDYQHIQSVLKEHRDKYVLAKVPGFAFNIARKLLKLDTYLVALMLEPERVGKLHDRIDKLIADMITNYAAVGVDAVFFTEDWGTQSQTFISPELWREEYKPRFQNICRLAHKCGVKVFMHSCGKITPIIVDLAEAGVDVLQFDQPTLHGIDTLADIQQSSGISFWCPVDIQKTLQTRNEQIIRAEAREMLDKLWKGRGGFIAGYYRDNASIGLPPEVQCWACDEFIKHGVAERYR